MATYTHERGAPVVSAPKSEPPEQIEDDLKSIPLKCPTCKTPVTVALPRSVIDSGKGGLVNVLIPDTVTPCHHAIQIFLDQTFKIRGYTRIDFVNHSGSEGAAHGHATSSKFDSLDEMDESLMTPEIRVLKENLGNLLREFASNVPQVKAIAAFTVEGFILAKLLSEEIDIEDVSMISASMMAQSTAIGRSLKIKLQDFSITSEKFKLTVIKGGEIMVILLYDKTVKEGYMKLQLKKLDANLKTISEGFWGKE